jgi:ADP-heptose:LPS heptosyltransferase
VSDPIADPIELQGPAVALVTPVDLAQACLALPAFRALQNSRPDLSPTLICPQSTLPFWALHFDQIGPYDDTASAKKLAGEFAQTDFHSAIFWEDSPATRALAQLEIPQRIGSTDPALAKLVTEAIPIVEPLGPPRHRLARYLDLAEALGCNPRQAANFAAPPLPPAPEIPQIALAPDSDLGPAAQWPLESFQQLTELIREELEVEFTLLAMPGNNSTAQELAGLLEIDPPNDNNLGELLTTLPTFSALVASDGTMPNLAATLGLPTVTLMGPRAVEVHRPPGTIHEPLTTHAECSPCNLSKCPLDHRCLRELTPERVAETALKLLAGREAADTEKS